MWFVPIQPQDVDPIAQCAMNMRKAGHLVLASDPAKQDYGFRRNLESIGRDARSWDDGLKDFVKTQAVMAVVKQDGAEHKVGFFIIRAWPFAVTNKPHEQELWIAGIFEAYRGQGYGSLLIDEVLRQFDRPDLALAARCAQASTQMRAMLLKRGFKEKMTLSGGFSLLLKNE